MMSVPEMADEANGVAIMYQAIGELPRANRDTLAFLMLHLQRLDLIYGLYRFLPSLERTLILNLNIYTHKILIPLNI